MLLLRWRHWQLLLRPGTPHEAAPHTHDTQSGPQLRPLPQDGNLQTTQGRPGGHDQIS